MPSSRYRPLARWLPSALIALGAFGGLVPTRAEASCSHYVTLGTPAGGFGAETRLELLALSNELLGGAPPAPADRPGPPPGPCPGGMCSGSPIQPLAPVPPEPPRPEPWGVLTLSADPDTPGRLVRPDEAPPRLPIGPLSPIDRPPRPI